MKIVVLDGYTLNPGDLSWAPLAELGEVICYDHTEREEIISRIDDAEVVLTNKTPLLRETIVSAPGLKYIGVLATGYNVVDIQVASERGIVVTNIPTYGTTAVAQYVFALLLAVCHRVEHHNQQVQQGRWTNGRDFCFWDYPLMELSGKTMGIIGYGRIGKATAQIARAFGMRVLAYDAYVRDDCCTDLDTLLRSSDVITLHCPYSLAVDGIVNRAAFSRMKDGVILINTARGQLIDEEDLRDALLSGKVYCAALDVVRQEPILSSNPLLGMDNCLITPHIAWAPRESRERLMSIAVSNLRAYLEGVPVNVVR